MKKGIKACIIAAISTIAIIFSCSFVLPAGAESYRKLAAVTQLEQLPNGTQLVTCEINGGELWAFYGEKWEIGDIVNLMFQDDAIIETDRVGHTESLENFFQMMGWR